MDYNSLTVSDHLTSSTHTLMPNKMRVSNFEHSCF